MKQNLSFFTMLFLSVVTGCSNTNSDPQQKLNADQLLDLERQEELQAGSDRFAERHGSKPTFRNGLFESSLTYKAAELTYKTGASTTITDPEILLQIFTCLSNCDPVTVIEVDEPIDLFEQHSILTLRHNNAEYNLTVEIDRGFFRPPDGPTHCITTNHIPDIRNNDFRHGPVNVDVITLRNLNSVDGYTARRLQIAD